MGRAPTELSGCSWICPGLGPTRGWLKTKRDAQESRGGTSGPSPFLKTLLSLAYGGALPSLVKNSPSLSPGQPLLTCSQGRRGRPTSPHGPRTSQACRRQSSCERGNTASGQARNRMPGLVLRRVTPLFPLCQPTNWGAWDELSTLPPAPNRRRIGNRVGQVWAVLAPPSSPTHPPPQHSPKPGPLDLPLQPCRLLSQSSASQGSCPVPNSRSRSPPRPPHGRGGHPSW